MKVWMNPSKNNKLWKKKKIWRKSKVTWIVLILMKDIRMKKKIKCNFKNLGLKGNKDKNLNF